ncbi:GNAT family N-acetyltransferase [Alteromonas facilis]|uniref:GNAT family N-acetyltransferase n=1 Tax=Alteromonas facilis TaxID=2048004 RepID=UPI000F5D36F4|nr:GNAT family N-acetyltransferase [Alteromonas facilis]
MTSLHYVSFDDVDSRDFITLLNQQRIREHLIQHDVFDEVSFAEWKASKQAMDSTKGCRVRALKLDEKLVGWCGIQLVDEQFEIALVLDESAWGLGKDVFKHIMQWAKEFNHRDIFIHLLSTRKEYRYLTKMAHKVFHSRLYGSQFTTYQFRLS